MSHQLLFLWVFLWNRITGVNCCPADKPHLIMSWQPLIPHSSISPHRCHRLFALLFCQDFPTPFVAAKNIHKSMQLPVHLLCSLVFVCGDSFALWSSWMKSLPCESPWLRPPWCVRCTLRHRLMQTGHDEAACALWTGLLMFSAGNPLISPPVFAVLFALFSAARVCDNAMLRCQNGGTCHHHQRCHCPPGFTGILCERAHCQGSGECEDQLSGRASFNHPAVVRWLVAYLMAIRLLIVFLRWKVTDGLPSSTKNS